MSPIGRTPYFGKSKATLSAVASETPMSAPGSFGAWRRNSMSTASVPSETASVAGRMSPSA
jgi:hypothetical protein